MTPQEGAKRLQDICADLQAVIEQHLGTGFVTGSGTAEERAEKVANGVVASAMLMQKLVAIALYQKLEKCPTDPEKAKLFVDKMVKDMTAMLYQRMDMMVAESMEQIAFAVLTSVEPHTTEH